MLTRENIQSIANHLDYALGVECDKAKSELLAHDAEQRQTIKAQAQRIRELEDELERWRILTESDYVQMVMQSRDFILHEFCQLQITYGEQKHRLRQLEAEVARMKGRIAVDEDSHL